MGIDSAECTDAKAPNAMTALYIFKVSLASPRRGGYGQDAQHIAMKTAFNF